MEPRHREQSDQYSDPSVKRNRERREAICYHLADCFVASGRLAMMVILSCVALSSLAQPKTFSSLSKYEKRWTFFHPFAAYKIKRHQKEMYAVYEEVKKNNLLDQYANGGKLDAFRHIFAMAYFSKFVKVKKLRKLGRAHEKGNYRQFLKGLTEEGEVPDSVSSVMDLANNEVGFSLRKIAHISSLAALTNHVIEVVKRGGALVMERNEQGFYLTCKGEIINMSGKKGTWGIPKCLVGSNS